MCGTVVKDSLKNVLSSTSNQFIKGTVVNKLMNQNVWFLYQNFLKNIFVTFRKIKVNLLVQVYNCMFPNLKLL